jgi:two-component system, NtrC family, response regulator HydG
MNRPRRILIVDDDRDVAESLADLIEARGHATTLAFGGEEGITRAIHHDFDFAFVDIKMPGLSGVETFFRLRRLKPEMGLWMMTGFSVDQLLRDAVERGTIRVLRQPLSAPEIITVLRGRRPRGILLVTTDHAGFAARMEPLLVAHGYKVSTARSSTEALDRILEGNADCLVLDRRLPTSHGLDAYLSLKWGGRDEPTIILDGNIDAEGQVLDIVRPMADAILRKPFDPEPILEKIDRRGLAA